MMETRGRLVVVVILKYTINSNFGVCSMDEFTCSFHFKESLYHFDKCQGYRKGGYQKFSGIKFSRNGNEKTKNIGTREYPPIHS